LVGRGSAEAVSNARRNAPSRSRGNQNEFPVFEVALGGLGLLMYILGSHLMGFMRSNTRTVRVRR
jgi:hypothetical protein